MEFNFPVCEIKHIFKHEDFNEIRELDKQGDVYFAKKK